MNRATEPSGDDGLVLLIMTRFPIRDSDRVHRGKAL